MCVFIVCWNLQTHLGIFGFLLPSWSIQIDTINKHVHTDLCIDIEKNNNSENHTIFHAKLYLVCGLIKSPFMHACYIYRTLSVNLMVKWSIPVRKPSGWLLSISSYLVQITLVGMYHFSVLCIQHIFTYWPIKSFSHKKKLLVIFIVRKPAILWESSLWIVLR